MHGRHVPCECYQGDRTILCHDIDASALGFYTPLDHAPLLLCCYFCDVGDLGGEIQAEEVK